MDPNVPTYLSTSRLGSPWDWILEFRDAIFGIISWLGFLWVFHQKITSETPKSPHVPPQVYWGPPTVQDEPNE